MTVKQKILFWIFLGVFIIPEILWSPISNYIYIFVKGGNTPIIWRNNFLIHSDNKNLLLGVLLIQLFGLLGSNFILLRKNSKDYFDITAIVIGSIILLLNFIILYILWTTRHIGNW